MIEFGTRLIFGLTAEAWLRAIVLALLLNSWAFAAWDEVRGRR